jgi:hypothetical protein
MFTCFGDKTRGRTLSPTHAFILSASYTDKCNEFRVRSFHRVWGTRQMNRKRPAPSLVNVVSQRIGDINFEGEGGGRRGRHLFHDKGKAIKTSSSFLLGVTLQQPSIH